MVFAVLVMQAQSYIIIVNNSNTTNSISQKAVSNYFLKKSLKWDNGDKVAPVDLSSKSSVRADFSKQVHNKSVSSVKSYWQQYVFAGKGTPPVEKHSDDEIIAYVKSNPGAIGYVSTDADIAGVKALTIN